MFKIFKILFIILCVFIFAAKMDAVSVSNWTDFKSVYESTTAASDIDLSGDISFGSDLLPLGHNIEINGNSYYMLGTSFFAGSFNGFSLNSKSMILKDIMLLGFHRYYLGAAIDALDSSIAFQNQIKFSDNLYIDKQNSYLSSMEYRGIISARKSTFSFVDNSSLFKDNVRIEYERNTAFIPITISIYGGAIYSASSIISFDRSTITFADNFYLNFSSNIIKGKTKVEAFGGAFYAKQSSVSFMSSSITFAGNGSFLITQSATSHSYEEPSSSPMPFKSMPPPEPDGDFAFYFYGGALYTSLSTMNINESKISFLSNNAYTEGGALYTQNSIINIAQSSIDFNYNSAITRNGGGAAFIESLLTFENSSISFKNNYAGVFGGALYTLLSSVSFDNVNLYFNANKSNYGGALFFNESQISFYNSTASFNNNIAEYGGAISFYESKANFTDASFSFTSNTAFGNGGAFYAEENSIIEFSSMNIVFSFNVLSPKIEIVSKGTYTIESVFPAMSGGAAYLYLSSMIFNNTNALFNENKSNWNGGAIYANNYSIIEFNNSTISFTNNISSQSGGAIALLKSKLIFRASSINFLSNTAKEKGAALYADNSTIIFESSPTVLTFDSNISSSNADDIYLTNNSSFIIKSQNLNMSAKIYADNKSAIESYVSSITISSLTIKNKSAFIMTAQNVQRASFTYLDIDGIISLRLSSSSFISAAQIYLGENSELELFLNDESLKHLTIKIIEVSNSSYAINRFANERDIIIDTPQGGRAVSSITYSSSSLSQIISVNIDEIYRLSEIPHLNSNQEAVASILDKSNYKSNPIMDEVGKPMFDELFASNAARALEILNGLTGQFLADILSSNLVKNNITGLYENIKKEDAASAIWTQYSIKSSVDSKEKENKKLSMSAFQAGLNIFTKEKSVIGLYASYEEGKFKQEPSYGEIKDIGGAIYYGYLTDNLNLKFHLGYGFQRYIVNRYIYGNYPNARSDFETQTLNAGANIEFIIPASFFELKPFIDAQYANRTNEKITERDSVNLIVKNQSLDELALSAGIGVSNDKNSKFNWLGRIYYTRLFMPSGNKYAMSFESAPEHGYFNINASDITKEFINVDLGFKYHLSNSFYIFTNINIIPLQKDLSAYYANLGITYNFGAKEEPAKEESKQEISETQQEQKQNQEQEQEQEQAIENIKALDIDNQTISAKPTESDMQEILTISQARATIREEQQGELAPLKTIFRLTGAVFQEGRYRLSPAGKQIIENLAKTIKQHTYDKITIEGHTDYIENKRGLSAKRASAIYNELLSNGIPAEKMTFKGLGPNSPLIKNNYPKSRIKNRRTDIIVQ